MTQHPESPLGTSDSFRILIETMAIGIVVFDRDARITYVNDALVAAIRSARARLIGLDLRKLRNPGAVAAVERALSGEEGVFEGPYDTVTSDYHIVMVLQCRPIRDAAGNVCGGFGTIQDASARFKVLDDLRQQLDVVERQAATIRALGAPILRVWDQIVCLPVIGAVDGDRARQLTTLMLDAIVKEGARFAVLDLTGVEIVDTETTQHLVQLSRAAILVGVEPVICGIGPAVAQAITNLGVDIHQIVTVATLHKALQHCIQGLRDFRARFVVPEGGERAPRESRGLSAV